MEGLSCCCFGYWLNAESARLVFEGVIHADGEAVAKGTRIQTKAVFLHFRTGCFVLGYRVLEAECTERTNYGNARAHGVGKTCVEVGTENAEFVFCFCADGGEGFLTGVVGYIDTHKRTEASAAKEITAVQCSTEKGGLFYILCSIACIRFGSAKVETQTE